MKVVNRKIIKADTVSISKIVKFLNSIFRYFNLLQKQKNELIE